MAIFNGSAEDIQSKQNMLSNLEAEEGEDKYPSVLGVKMYVDEIITSEREYNKEALSGKESISNKTNDLIANGGSEEMYPSASAVREYVDKKIGEIGGGGDSSEVDLSKCANALKSKASGEVIRIDDVSPIEHTVKIKAKRKNLLNADGMVNGAFVKNDDGSYTFTKISKSARFSEWVDISIPANVTFAFSATNIEGTAKDFAFQIKLEDGRSLGFGPLSPTNLSYRGAYLSSKAVQARIFFGESLADGTYLNISGLQIELGVVATEYSPYAISVIVSPDGTSTSATEYTPDADGFVNGVKSLYPSMVVTTDDAGASVEVEYNKDINKGVSKTWRTIRDFTIENEEAIANDTESGITWTVDDSGNITAFEFNTDADGKPLSANKLRYIIYPSNNLGYNKAGYIFGGKRGYLRVYCNEQMSSLYNATATAEGWMVQGVIEPNMAGILTQVAYLHGGRNSYANERPHLNTFDTPGHATATPPIKKLKIACDTGIWFVQGAKVLVQVCEEVE